MLFKSLKSAITVSIVLLISACGGGGSSAPAGVTPTSISIPTPSQPVFSSVVGVDATVNLAGLDPAYAYHVYVSSIDSSDLSENTSMATVSANRVSDTDTWAFPLAALGITSPLVQDQVLFVRLQAGDSQGNYSDLSSPLQVTLLSAPELTSVGAVAKQVTLGWVAEAGKSYNVYYKSNGFGDANLGTANKILTGPFTTGSASFSVEGDGSLPYNCNTSSICYIGITKVEGNSESTVAFAGTNGIRLANNTTPTLSIDKAHGDSVTLRVSGNVGMNNYRVYSSTDANPTTANASLIYDSANDANSTGYVESPLITQFYDVNGQPISYNYLYEGYAVNSYTNSAGVATEFFTTSLPSMVQTYVPSISDFTLQSDSSAYGYIPATNSLQMVGGSLYWYRSSNYGDIYQYPLDELSAPTATSGGGSQRTAFLVEPSNPSIHYTAGSNGVRKYDTVTSSNNFLDVGQSIRDMVQTSTDLYLLTISSIIKVAKANVATGGSFTELATGLSGALDLDIDEATNTLYAATAGGVVSLPIAGGTPTLESPSAARFVALNAAGTKLYAMAQTINASIREIDLVNSVETTVQQHVTNDTGLYSTGMLEVIGDWLYFSARNGTYRRSLVDGSIDRLATASAVNIVPGVANSPPYILMGNAVFQYPEDFYTAIPAVPTAPGTITTASGDNKVVVSTPVSAYFDFYTINGQVVDALYAANTEVLNLTNGQAANIDVIAYNIAGGSAVTSVTDIPNVSAPNVSLASGSASGQLDLSISWNNPLARDLTLKLYRSTAPVVDTTAAAFATFSYISTDPEGSLGNVTVAYSDSAGLTDGSLYYYAATLNDVMTLSADSVVAGTVPFTPYPLLSAVGPTTGVTNFNNKLYWADGYVNGGVKVWDGVLAKPLEDNSLTRMGFEATDLVADTSANALFVTTRNSTAIDKITVDATAGWIETVHVDTGVSLERLIGDASHLYASGSGQVIAVTRADGTMTTLYASMNSIVWIAEAGAYVYWTENMSSSGSIKRVLKTGGAEETIVSEALPVNTVIGDLAVDAIGSYVFYSVPNTQVSGMYVIKKYDTLLNNTSVLTDTASAAGFSLDSNGDVLSYFKRTPLTGVEYREIVKVSATDGTVTPVHTGLKLTDPVRDIYQEGVNLYLKGSPALYQLQ